MGHLSSFGLVAALALLQVPGTPPPSPKTLLREVQGLIGQIISSTEKAVALLAYAQAQERIGDKEGALNSLRLGWSAHQSGPIRAHSVREEFDPQTLLDSGDLATLPEVYAYEFVVAGDVADARSAAMSLGDSRLADAFRDGLGRKLLTKYSKEVEFVTVTDRQRENRIVVKQGILDGLAAIRAESDLEKRARDLLDAADRLTRVDGKAEAAPLLRESAAAAGKLADPKWRVIYEAEIADVAWHADAKIEASDLLKKAETEVRAIQDLKGRLDARSTIEHTKQSMGRPNEFDTISGSPGGVKPVAQTSAAPPTLGSSQPSDLLTAAGWYRAKGDVTAAKKALRKVKDTAGGDGWWLVLAAEMQIQIGDRIPALENLAVGGRRFIEHLRPQPSVNHEHILQLEQIANDQKAVGDKAAALKTLLDGYHRLAFGERWVNVMQMGPGSGGKDFVKRDRQSPVLHVGAVALANAGFYSEAIALARTIENPAQRAVAISGAIRDGLPSNVRIN